MCSNELVNSSLNPYLCNYPCSGLIQMCGGFTSGYVVYQIAYKPQTTTEYSNTTQPIYNTTTTTPATTTISMFSMANDPTLQQSGILTHSKLKPHFLSMMY